MARSLRPVDASVSSLLSRAEIQRILVDLLDLELIHPPLHHDKEPFGRFSLVCFHPVMSFRTGQERVPISAWTAA